MATVLEQLLGNLEQALGEVERRANDAYNNFMPPAAVIIDKEECEACIGKFYLHLECAIPGAKKHENDLSVAWLYCCELLKSEFGGTPPATIFDIVRTGNEGGLLKVLRVITQLMIKKHAEGRIGFLVYKYWESRSAEELLADSDEYLGEYGHLLPPELTEGSAGRIRVNFIKVLKQHPYLIRQIQRVGRSEGLL